MTLTKVEETLGQSGTGYCRAPTPPPSPSPSPPPTHSPSSHVFASPSFSFIQRPASVALCQPIYRHSFVCELLLVGAPTELSTLCSTSPLRTSAQRLSSSETGLRTRNEGLHHSTEKSPTNVGKTTSLSCCDRAPQRKPENFENIGTTADHRPMRRQSGGVLHCIDYRWCVPAAKSQFPCGNRHLRRGREVVVRKPKREKKGAPVSGGCRMSLPTRHHPAFIYFNLAQSGRRARRPSRSTMRYLP